MNIEKHILEMAENISFIRDNAVFKSDFDKAVNEIRGDVAELKVDMRNVKKDVAELKTDVAELKVDMRNVKNDLAAVKIELGDVKGEIIQIKDHVMCLRYAVQESVTVLQEKKIMTEKDKDRVYEAGQFASATI